MSLFFTDDENRKIPNHKFLQSSCPSRRQEDEKWRKAFTCSVDKSVVEEKGLVHVTGRERGLEKRDEAAAPENGSWGKRCLKRICI